MASLTVSDVQPDEINRLASFFAMAMRPADFEEAVAVVGGYYVREALVSAMTSSTICWVARDEEGRGVLLGGVSAETMLSRAGCPWMIGSLWADRYPSALTKIARGKLPEMLGRHPFLYNWVDARNTASVEWLARLGFRLYDPEPYGPFGLPFHRFEMEA